MATTTWTYGQQGSGLYFKLVYDSAGTLSVNMLEGSMDLNALYVSDGDRTIEGAGTTLAKKDSALNMNGTGVTWDDMVFLNSAGLGGKDQASYFLKAGDSYALTSAQLTDLLGWQGLASDDLSALTVGVRATSVNGGDSIKAVMALEEPDSFYISIGRLDAQRTDYGAWFDSDKDGVHDEGEAEIETTGPTGFNYHYTLNNIDFGSGDYTVRFVDIVYHDGAALVGGVDFNSGSLLIESFGASDTIIVDMTTNASDWMGLKDMNVADTNILPNAPDSAQTGTTGAPVNPMFNPDGLDFPNEYGDLTRGTMPADDTSTDPNFSLLRAATINSDDQIVVFAATYLPAVSPNPGGQLGDTQVLAEVVGVPLDANNVTYMMPTFG